MSLKIETRAACSCDACERDNLPMVLWLNIQTSPHHEDDCCVAVCPDCMDALSEFTRQLIQSSSS